MGFALLLLLRLGILLFTGGVVLIALTLVFWLLILAIMPEGRPKARTVVVRFLVPEAVIATIGAIIIALFILP